MIRKLYIILLLINMSWAGQAQQIILDGIVTLHNSRGNASRPKPVPGVWISHPKAKPQITDSQGRFRLYFSELSIGESIQLSIKPQGAYRDYLVVNAKEIQRITLGRIEPISIYISSKKELEERRAQLVGINIQKYQECRTKQIQSLKLRIAQLETLNLLKSDEYKRNIDSLQHLQENEERTLQRIRRYAQQLALINVDEADEVYRGAYRLFEQGKLDSLCTYLDIHIRYEEETKSIQEQENKIQRNNALAASLKMQAEHLKANTDKAKRTLAQKLLLSARAYTLRHRYKEATERYAQLIQLDDKEISYLNEAASLAHSIRDYLRAESYFLDALYLTPQTSPQRAKTLNNLGVLYQDLADASKAQYYLQQALPIWEEEVKKQDKLWLPHLARCLNNLGVVLGKQGETLRAAQYLKQALSIREQIAKKGQTTAQWNLVKTLSSLGAAYHALGRNNDAIQYLERALKIHQKLVLQGSTPRDADLTKVLNNLGALYSLNNEFERAEKYLKEALELLNILNSRKPKVYESDLARSLHNIGVCYAEAGKLQLAEQMLLKAADIRRKLAHEHPKIYSTSLKNTLKHLQTVNNKKQKQNANNTNKNEAEISLSNIVNSK